jgi:signal transduction histidine kinase
MQKKEQTYLKKIQISGQLLLDLVNDTLELSRIESGKLVLKPELVDGQEFWESVVTALSPSAAMKNIHLETDTGFILTK